MSITRRSLLRSAATVPAVYALSGCHCPQSAGPINHAAATGPSPNSIFVLFAGPWLIYPAPTQSNPNQIGALTVDNSIRDERGNPAHQCPVEKWQNGQKNSSISLDMAPDPNGATIQVSNYSQASYAPPRGPDNFSTDFYGAFSAPFGFDQFVWISNRSSGSPAVTRKATDRGVYLPLPTAVYMGGFLSNVTVTQSAGQDVLRQDNVNPHVATIFEYSLSPQGGLSLTLTLPGGSPIQFNPGDHLVFHVQHHGDMICADEMNHMMLTFNFLTGHLNPNPLNSPSFKSTTSFENFRVGDHTSGIAQDELQLQFIACTPPEQPKQEHPNSDTYANCAGGGIIVGP